jgi:hypothetical protein
MARTLPPVPEMSDRPISAVRAFRMLSGALISDAIADVPRASSSPPQVGPFDEVRLILDRGDGLLLQAAQRRPVPGDSPTLRLSAAHDPSRPLTAQEFRQSLGGATVEAVRLFGDEHGTVRRLEIKPSDDAAIEIRAVAGDDRAAAEARIALIGQSNDPEDFFDGPDGELVLA